MVNVIPDLFVGLVTHENSRFGDAGKETGLLRRVEAGLTRQGLRVATILVDEDAWNPDVLPITIAEVRASIDAEIDSERRWREYVLGSRLSVLDQITLSLRRLRRRFTLTPPWKARIREQDDGFRLVRRLVNIELAHVKVLRAAVDSKARWVLVLEDDASTDSPERFSFELGDFLRRADRRGAPSMVNLSESFTSRELGIDHLLSRNQGEDNFPWPGFSAKRPVTNTVCAVLYSRALLAPLVTALDGIPLSPVIPIDFKVNEAVMEIAHDQAPGSCWVLSPAPLRQGSGVPTLHVRR